MKKYITITISILLLITITTPFTVNAKTAKETLLENVVTTGDGLYKDEYEEGRYIYKGENPKNYITFNDEYAGWRILSVEKNGTIKIIKANNIGSIKFDDQHCRNETCTSENYCLKLGDGCNAWVSNKNLIGRPETFINGSREGIVYKDSDSKKLLNETYYNSLTFKAKTLISINTFNVGPTSKENLSKNLTKDELYQTIKSEKTYQWKGRIGLATFSEYVRAQNWIFNKEPALMITPEYDSVVSLKLANATDSLGKQLNQYSAAYIQGGDYEKDSIKAFPVLYLKSNINLSGSGTKKNPYTLTNQVPVTINLETFGDLNKDLQFKLDTAGKTLSEIKKEIDNQIGTKIEKDGKCCTLDSWYLDKDLKNRFDENTPINNNLTLFGRWECRETETVNVPDTLLQIPNWIINLGCSITIVGILLIVFIIKKKNTRNEE